MADLQRHWIGTIFKALTYSLIIYWMSTPRPERSARDLIASSINFTAIFIGGWILLGLITDQAGTPQKIAVGVGFGVVFTMAFLPVILATKKIRGPKKIRKWEHSTAAYYPRTDRPLS